MRHIIYIAFLLLPVLAVAQVETTISGGGGGVDSSFVRNDSVFVISEGVEVFTGVASASGLPAGTLNQILTYNGTAWVGDNTPVVANVQVTNALTINPTQNDLIDIQRNWDGTYPVGNGHGVSDETIINKPGGVAYASFDGRVSIEGGHTYDHYASHQAAPTVVAGTTVNTLWGGYAIPQIAGNVPYRVGWEAADFSGAGTVGLNVGLRCRRLNNGVLKYPLLLDSVMEARPDGSIRFNAFGGGAFAVTSTPYVYATNIWGDLKEITPTNLVRGVVGFNLAKGAGLLNRLPVWGSADSLTYVPNIFIDAVNTKIGIGYTSSPPGNGISIFRTIAGIDLISSNNSSHTLQCFNSSPSNKLIFSAGRGTPTVPTALINGSIIGIVDFEGHDGTVMRNGGSIQMVVDGTPSSNNMPTKMIFATRRSAFGGASDAGAISALQNWGIGRTNPGYRLDVLSASNVTVPIMKLQNSNDSTFLYAYSSSPNGVFGAKQGSLLSYTNTTKAGLYCKIFGTSTTGWGLFLNELDGRGAITGQNLTWDGDSWEPFTPTDNSVTNEGSLGVGVAGANSATIVSNTSGGTPVTIEGSTNVKVTENQPAGIITLSVPDTVFITLSALSSTDSLKTVSTLGRDFFNVPAELAGFTVSKVEYSAFAAGAGSGSITTSLRLFNSARTFTGSSNAVTWAVGDAIKTSTGAFTLALGQLIVPQITADTMTQHPLGLSVVLMLTRS